jgi:methyl-accepting chemotaxis protein
VPQVASIRAAAIGEAELDRLSSGLDGPPVLVAAFASSSIDLGAVLSTLSERFRDAVVIGSSTSGEFTEDGDGSGTVAVFALSGDYRVFAGMAVGLASSPERAVQAALEGQPTSVAEFPHRTNIVLLDSLAGHGEEAALLVAASIGDVPLVGGAAGDDLAMKQTVVGLGARAAPDAIVVASIFSREPLGIGVCHGHKPLTDPIRVTRATGSVVEELDGRPAWDVWREKTAGRARELGLDAEASPGAYLLRFEAGLRIGHEYKVRAPLSPKPGGGILFATPVLEGTVFRIMESDPSAQVESAAAAAREARAALGGKPVEGALVFDCICRKLILGDRYVDALTSVSAELGSVPLAGFETYGEVAMNSGDMSGFHNTTTVVLAFPRHDD